MKTRKNKLGRGTANSLKSCGHAGHTLFKLFFTLILSSAMSSHTAFSSSPNELSQIIKLMIAQQPSTASLVKQYRLTFDFRVEVCQFYREWNKRSGTHLSAEQHKKFITLCQELNSEQRAAVDQALKKAGLNDEQIKSLKKEDGSIDFAHIQQHKIDGNLSLAKLSPEKKNAVTAILAAAQAHQKSLGNDINNALQSSSMINNVAPAEAQTALDSTEPRAQQNPDSFLSRLEELKQNARDKNIFISEEELSGAKPLAAQANELLGPTQFSEALLPSSPVAEALQANNSNEPSSQKSTNESEHGAALTTPTPSPALPTQHSGANASHTNAGTDEPPEHAKASASTDSPPPASENSSTTASAPSSEPPSPDTLKQEELGQTSAPPTTALAGGGGSDGDRTPATEIPPSSIEGENIYETLGNLRVDEASASNPFIVNETVAGDTHVAPIIRDDLENQYSPNFLSTVDSAANPANANGEDVNLPLPSENTTPLVWEGDDQVAPSAAPFSIGAALSPPGNALVNTAPLSPASGSDQNISHQTSVTGNNTLVNYGEPSPSLEGSTPLQAEDFTLDQQTNEIIRMSTKETISVCQATDLAREYAARIIRSKQRGARINASKLENLEERANINHVLHEVQQLQNSFDQLYAILGEPSFANSVKNCSINYKWLTRVKDDFQKTPIKDANNQIISSQELKNFEATAHPALQDIFLKSMVHTVGASLKNDPECDVINKIVMLNSQIGHDKLYRINDEVNSLPKEEQRAQAEQITQTILSDLKKQMQERAALMKVLEAAPPQNKACLYDLDAIHHLNAYVDQKPILNEQLEPLSTEVAQNAGFTPQAVTLQDQEECGELKEFISYLRPQITSLNVGKLSCEDLDQVALSMLKLKNSDGSFSNAKIPYTSPKEEESLATYIQDRLVPPHPVFSAQEYATMGKCLTKDKKIVETIKVQYAKDVRKFQTNKLIENQLSLAQGKGPLLSSEVSKQEALIDHLGKQHPNGIICTALNVEKCSKYSKKGCSPKFLSAKQSTEAPSRSFASEKSPSSPASSTLGAAAIGETHASPSSKEGFTYLSYGSYSVDTTKTPLIIDDPPAKIQTPPK